MQKTEDEATSHHGDEEMLQHGMIPVEKPAYGSVVPPGLKAVADNQPNGIQSRLQVVQDCNGSVLIAVHMQLQPDIRQTV